MGLFSDLMYDDEDPKNVAKAYSLMNEQMKRDEGAKEDQAWNQTFEGLKQRGFSPSAALIESENSMGGIAPGTGQGSGYQEPDALQRWKQQVDSMIQSGNPVLQKEGLAQLSQYQARAATPLTAETDRRTMGAKYADELGLKGKPRLDFIERYANKKNFAPELTSVADAKSLAIKPGQETAFRERFGRANVGPGMDMAEVAPYVDAVDPKNVGEVKTANVIVDQLDEMLFNDIDGIMADQEAGLFPLYSAATKATWEQYAQNDSRYKNYQDYREGNVVGLAKALGESGNLAIQDVERAKSLIPSLMLPFPDSPKVAKQKLAMLKKVIAANSRQDYSGVKALLDAASNKGLVSKKKKPGDTWEDADYAYRVSEDGSTQRRAK